MTFICYTNCVNYLKKEVVRGLKKTLFTTIGILTLALSINSCDSSIANCNDENATTKSANEKSYRYWWQYTRSRN